MTPRRDRTTVDVMVVGGGGAGLSAAAEAAKLGRSVMVIEKAPRLGGTSAMAVGSLMGAGTRMQRAAGIVDSPDRHEAELIEVVAAAGAGDNPALRRLLVEHLGETVDLMESIGVDFLGPLPQPPFPTPRFYQALPGGRVYIRRLAAWCRRLGVDLRVGSEARRLECRAGRVVAVAVRDARGTRMIEVCHGVVLASGDLSANREMRQAIWGDGLAALDPMNIHATGDGQRLGLSAGGRLALRDDLVPHGVPRFALPKQRPLAERLPPWRPVTRAMKLALRYLPERLSRPLILRAAMTALAPERGLYAAGAVMVNRSGDRFVDETGPVGGAIASQPNGEAFVLFDAVVARQFSRWPDFVSTAPGIAYAYVEDYLSARPDIARRLPSLPAVAAWLGCPAERLTSAMSPTTAEPPFIVMGPLKTWLLLTPAGLVVDTELRVLDSDDRPIPGLFAAGGCGQGGLSFTHYHHGHSLGWALTSGRLAGRAAAGGIS